MRVCGCVVLYNPDDDVLENISTYIHLVDKLFVMDNSTKDIGSLIKELLVIDKVEYYNLGGNHGIAYALNQALRLCVKQGYGWCLTMDQDSKFPLISNDDLYSRFDVIENINQYGIIGLNYNFSGSYKGDDGLVEVDLWLTSGNFINAKNYRLIQGFRTELFIDYVDFDLCHQFHMIGKKVAYFQNLGLIHRIGTPKTIRLFGKEIHAMNHSPIRYYYRFRNARFLYEEDKKFYRKKYWHDLLVDIPKVILFEDDKKKKLKMIRLGRRDAKCKKLGEFDYE